MPVHAVDAGVDLAVDEPLRVRGVPLQHPAPRLAPFQLVSEASPEALRVAVGFFVHGCVLDHGLLHEFGGRLEDAVFVK